VATTMRYDTGKNWLVTVVTEPTSDRERWEEVITHHLAWAVAVDCQWTPDAPTVLVTVRAGEAAWASMWVSELVGERYVITSTTVAPADDSPDPTLIAVERS
jgi:hypothetical protein